MKESSQDVPSTGSKMLKGTVILGIAALISKLLGTLQKIPLQNIAGDRVFGIYNLVYPWYILILFLSTGGFPIAVSKFVSEHMARGEVEEAKRLLRIASVVLSLSGLLFFLLLYFGAPIIANWIGVEETAQAIRSISFALLFVPLMAALRGYFQGMQDMMPTAISQVIEQLIRVSTMIGLLIYLTDRGFSEAVVAAGATFGSVVGAAAGLFFMIIFWWNERKKGDIHHAVAREYSWTMWKMIKQFMWFAIPVSIGSIVFPLLRIVDTFTLPRLLGMHGFSYSQALSQIGIYNRGTSLIQLIIMIAASLSVVLVPAIAEAKLNNQLAIIRIRTELAIRLTWMIGLAASFGLAIAAVPINIMFYKNSAGSFVIMIVAFTGIFSTLHIVSGAILTGIGKVKVPVVNLLVAVLVKLSLNFVLIPLWGIEGAAVTAVITFATAAGLNLFYLKKQTGMQLKTVVFWFKPFFAVFIMSICLFLIGIGAAEVRSMYFLTISSRIWNMIVSLLMVGSGIVIYVFSVFKIGAISKEDLDLVPSLKRKILPWLYKFRLLPKQPQKISTLP